MVVTDETTAAAVAKAKAEEDAMAKAEEKAKAKAEAEAKAAATKAAAPLDGIPGWLESIEAGFAESFAGVFEEIGVEDLSDFEHMDEETMGELESALKDAGASDAQVGKITMGMVTGASPAAEPAAPAPVVAAPAVAKAGDIGGGVGDGIGDGIGGGIGGGIDGPWRRHRSAHHGAAALRRPRGLHPGSEGRPERAQM